MRQIRTCLAVCSALLLLVLVLSRCNASPSVQASAVVLVSPTPEPTEAIATLEPQPAEGPDPVATEYALAALATPTSIPATLIGQPTLDTLRALEAHATRPTLPPPAGRNPQAFSKAGDSTIESPNFLGRFDSSPYNLGDYRNLQAVIDHFKGSYGRKSMAVRIGQHSWTLLNPAWADKKQCNADETPLACELRQNNPGILILRLGANNSGVTRLFERNMRAVVEYAIDHGVIPVLSTKPDQRQGTEQVNAMLRKLPIDYRVPLWDFDRVASTLSDRGLGPDGGIVISPQPLRT